MRFSDITVKPWNIPGSILKSNRMRNLFFDGVKLQVPLSRRDWIRPTKWIKKRRGFQSLLEDHRNQYQGKRCFIIGNGPSLKDMNLTPLQHEITMGANGLYKLFEDWGFSTKYLFFEDRVQTYQRHKEINSLSGVTKMVALTMAYCVESDCNTLFFNERFPCDKRAEYTPRFSKEFASVAFLGGTITYVMIQWAFYLGCDPIYIIGVDHDYGILPDVLPPGKIKITPEIMETVSKLHMKKDYYKIGDEIGVPNVHRQNLSYSLANKVIHNSGRKIINVGLRSKLTAFPTANFQDII